ncbi:MAG: di/tricarboxylate transporter [Gammaproteobacteria bacterium]|jgi:di/tricarboxylate transporter
MTIVSIITLVVLISVFLVLILRGWSPDIILWTGVIILLVIPVEQGGDWQLGVLDPHDVLAGFANEGVMTIAALFIVAAGLRDTGFLQVISQYLLGNTRSIFSAQNRIIWPTAAISAFMNNTPVVAIMMPAVDEWARRNGLPISRLLIPLSYASILGGACTLIGTSSNLIINGWLISELGHPGLGMFEISKLGIPIALFGLSYILVTGRWLLEDRAPVIDPNDDARQYTVEMIVESNGALVGKTVGEAGLRGLNGLYLVEIDRDEEILVAVSSDIVLHDDDRLIFAGVIDSVVDLQKFRGLRPATNQIFKLNESRRQRHMIQAVVSNRCPLVGKSIREGKFRTNYNAAVIAVARSGDRINKKIGDIVLEVGDVLLLEARSNFLEQQKNRADFYLISKVDGAKFFDHKQTYISVSILIAMIIMVASGLITIFTGALMAAGLMIITGCCSADSARRAIDLETILVIVAALALGRAMEASGLATLLGQGLFNLLGDNPHLMLSAIFAVTMLLGNIVTAKAGGVLMLPIVISISGAMGISYLPLVIAVMMASATALATPIGYPTNVMIFGVGGYKFSDYLRMGIPLSIGIWLISTILIPVYWPF